MIIFQTKSAFVAQKISTDAPYEIRAIYRNNDTGKEYRRNILTRADGKVFDPMMNSNPGSEAAWTTKERWQAKLGLNLKKFEFSFGGKADEKREKVPLTPGTGFSGNLPALKRGNSDTDRMPQGAKAPPEKRINEKKSAFVASGADAFHGKIEDSPVHAMIKGHLKNDFSAYLERITKKEPGEKSSLELAYEYGKKYNVDPVLILAIIFGESAGKVNPGESTSKGLMQLEPATAYSITGLDGRKIIRKSADLLNKAKNIEAGTAYIARQLAKQPDDIAIALYGYNGGPGNAKKLVNSNYAEGSKSAADYAQKMLGAYKLFSEMGIGALMNGMGVAEIQKTEKFANAIADINNKAKSGYLSGFDFGKNFTQTQDREIAANNPFMKISPPK